MSFTRTVESRPYDTHYDPVYTGASRYSHLAVDPRVSAVVSSSDMVAGTHRFQYFRRPIMPRISAIPPQILLASSNSKFDPMVAVEEEPEPLTKNAEVQTVSFIINQIKHFIFCNLFI